MLSDFEHPAIPAVVICLQIFPHSGGTHTLFSRSLTSSSAHLIFKMPSFTHEVEFGVAASAIWAALKDQETLLPKIVPEAIASIETIEGSGEPGSCRIIKFAPTLKGALGPKAPDSVTEKLVSLDVDNYSVVSEEVEGGNKQQFGFSKWVTTLTFIPVTDSTSKLEFSAEFEGGSEGDAIAAVLQAKQGLNKTFKAIEEYVKSKA